MNNSTDQPKPTSFLNHYELPVSPSPTHSILDGSKLNCFMTCPRMFFYEYILGWRFEGSNIHLVFGTAWHEAMEHLLTNGFEDNSILEAYNRFLASFRSEFPDESLDEMFHPKTPDRALEALVGYAERYKTDQVVYEVLYVEINGTVQMDQKRVLFFRMDSILRDIAKYKIVSLEHKTGGRFSRAWEDQWSLSMQNGIYTHALFCLYPADEVLGTIFNGTFFHKVKPDSKAQKFDYQRVHAYRSKSQMQTWYTNTLYWMDQVENEYKLLAQCSDSNETLVAFPLNTTSCANHYGKPCRYLDFCNAWKNPLQKCSQPPIGFQVEHWDPSERQSEKTVEMTLSQEKSEIKKQGA